MDLTGDSRAEPVAGSMVLIAPRYNDHTQEFALGTVNDVTTQNRWHEDVSLRGVVAHHGHLPGLSGRADIKTADVDIQAVFRQASRGIEPFGGGLSNSPSTGDRVYRATNEFVEVLAAAQADDLYYCGEVYRSGGLLLPLSTSNFAGPRGASNAAFFGPSGSGKTTAATFHLAGMLRHLDQGMLLVDPQGQFTSGRGIGRELPLDLRALAAAQGRHVEVRNVVSGLRLPQEPELFVEMLTSSRFFTDRGCLGLRGDIVPDTAQVVARHLGGQTEWSAQDPDQLLDGILTDLVAAARRGDIYATLKTDDHGEPTVDNTKAGNRIYHNWRSALEPTEYTDRDGVVRRGNLLQALTPIIGVFGPVGLNDVERLPLQDLVRLVCDTDSSPRPFVVLSLTDTSLPGELRRLFGRQEVQTTILRVLFRALEREALKVYQRGDTSVNLLVGMDEARRFAGKPRSFASGEQRELADDLGRYMREMRKLGVGWTFILQSPSELHPAIWSQLHNGFRAFAGGLTGSDLDMLREQMPSSGAMSLYRAFPAPSADHPVYPFLLCGSASPLSCTAAPLAVTMFTDFAQWRRANDSWLPRHYRVTDVWRGP